MNTIYPFPYLIVNYHAQPLTAYAYKSKRKELYNDSMIVKNVQFKIHVVWRVNIFEQ